MLIFHKQKIGISPDWLSSKGQIIIFLWVVGQFPKKMSAQKKSCKLSRG